MKLLLLSIILLSGCSMFQHTEDRERKSHNDCELTLPDGTYLRCSGGATRDDEVQREGKDLQAPVGY